VAELTAKRTSVPPGTAAYWHLVPLQVPLQQSAPDVHAWL
jgi:hypothetical protein